MWQTTMELAALKLEEEEMESLAREAERMRELFATMSEINVDGIEPTTHALASGNRIRKDEHKPFGDAAALLEAAPEAEDDYFIVPNVL